MKAFIYHFFITMKSMKVMKETELNLEKAFHHEGHEDNEGKRI
ncbi:hypothetical protein [Methylotuvimicrobium sp. KM1]